MPTSSMISALRAIRYGGKVTKDQYHYLIFHNYVNEDYTLTMKGHNELNNDDNKKEDKVK